MKERPILFSSAMVRAILEDRKSQTRRVIKPQPLNPKWTGSEWVEAGNDDTKHFSLKCPHGAPGDELWVRETWYGEFYDTLDIDGPSRSYHETPRNERTRDLNTGIWYKADTPDINRPFIEKWVPSIFMPRWASRITLEITDVRVEKIKDISGKDALAEGIQSCSEYREAADVTDFQELWDSINKKRGFGWDTNCFVWVISFKRIEL